MDYCNTPKSIEDAWIMRLCAIGAHKEHLVDCLDELKSAAKTRSFAIYDCAAKQGILVPEIFALEAAKRGDMRLCILIHSLRFESPNFVDYLRQMAIGGALTEKQSICQFALNFTPESDYREICLYIFTRAIMCCVRPIIKWIKNIVITRGIDWDAFVIDAMDVLSATAGFHYFAVKEMNLFTEHIMPAKIGNGPLHKNK